MGVGVLATGRTSVVVGVTDTVAPAVGVTIAIDLARSSVGIIVALDVGSVIAFLPTP
jgi:hypothetical protein